MMIMIIMVMGIVFIIIKLLIIMVGGDAYEENNEYNDNIKNNIMKMKI